MEVTVGTRSCFHLREGKDKAQHPVFSMLIVRAWTNDFQVTRNTSFIPESLRSCSFLNMAVSRITLPDTAKESRLAAADFQSSHQPSTCTSCNSSSLPSQLDDYFRKFVNYVHPLDSVQLRLFILVESTWHVILFTGIAGLEVVVRRDLEKRADSAFGLAIAAALIFRAWRS